MEHTKAELIDHPLGRKLLQLGVASVFCYQAPLPPFPGLTGPRAAHQFDAAPSAPATGAGLGEQSTNGLEGDEWLARQLLGFLDLYGRTLRQQGCADADVSDFLDFAMHLDGPAQGARAEQAAARGMGHFADVGWDPRRSNKTKHIMQHVTVRLVIPATDSSELPWPSALDRATHADQPVETH